VAGGKQRAHPGACSVSRCFLLAGARAGKRIRLEIRGPISIRTATDARSGRPFFVGPRGDVSCRWSLEASRSEDNEGSDEAEHSRTSLRGESTHSGCGPGATDGGQLTFCRWQNERRSRRSTTPATTMRANAQIPGALLRKIVHCGLSAGERRQAEGADGLPRYRQWQRDVVGSRQQPLDLFTTLAGSTSIMPTLLHSLPSVVRVKLCEGLGDISSLLT
jgi:hypothetical protein